MATVRQARRTWEPDPVWAATEAHLGGADGITVHLGGRSPSHPRRRRSAVSGAWYIKLNLEMAATPEMVKIAIATQPHTVMLVPEGREVTTEGA